MESKRNLPNAFDFQLPIYFLLSVGLLAAIGSWLVFTLVRQAPPPEPASVGEPVQVPGGALRIEAVYEQPKHTNKMMNNNAKRFGVSMSVMGMDMPPSGYKRIVAFFTLASERPKGLQYSAEDFYLTGKETKEIAPLRAGIGTETVPMGSAASGSLTFQVPEQEKSWLLHFPGADKPVLLDPEAATPHHHGEAGQDYGEDGHDHDHDHDH